MSLQEKKENLPIALKAHSTVGMYNVDLTTGYVRMSSFFELIQKQLHNQAIQKSLKQN